MKIFTNYKLRKLEAQLSEKRERLDYNKRYLKTLSKSICTFQSCYKAHSVESSIRELKKKFADLSFENAAIEYDITKLEDMIRKLS